MNNNIFTDSQIRQIIEKITQIAKINNGIVSISKIDDAASLAAYIAGYSSWKQYRKINQSEKLLSLDVQNNIIEERDFKHLILDLSVLKISEFKSYLKSFSKDKDNFELRENKQLAFKIAVGQSYSKITKANQVHYLNVENTCFIGDETNFMEVVQDSLEHQMQTIISFKAGKSANKKLDPINEIFSGDYLEEFLSDHTSDHKGFTFIWALLIKQLVQQYKINFTADFLIKTLDLDFVLKYWFVLNQEHNFLSSILMNYVKSLAILHIDSEHVHISEDVQKKHWKNVSKIYNQLSVFKDCYDQNIFSYDGVNLTDVMKKKESVSFYIPTKLNEFIYKMLDFLIHSSVLSYQKHVEGLSSAEHTIFILNSNEKLLKSPIKSDYVINFVHALPYETYRLNEFDQVVFSNHSSFMLPSQGFITKFYLNTAQIDENIFTNSGDLLLKLNGNSGYLWQKENKETMFSSFVLKKIIN